MFKVHLAINQLALNCFFPVVTQNILLTTLLMLLLSAAILKQALHQQKNSQIAVKTIVCYYGTFAAHTVW